MDELVEAFAKASSYTVRRVTPGDGQSAPYHAGKLPPNYPVPSTIFLGYCWDEWGIAPINRYWQPYEGKKA